MEKVRINHGEKEEMGVAGLEIVRQKRGAQGGLWVMHGKESHAIRVC